MKDIKFRGLTTKGEFAYGSLVVAEQFIQHKPKQHSKTWIITSAFGNGGWFNVRKRVYVLPETVGQFIGLEDMNQVDIYAGDKITLHHDDGESNYNGVVTYDNVSCSWGMLCDHNDWSWFEQIDGRNLEVFGNIHKNK